MSDNFIDYGRLIDDAMHVIVKKALESISKDGLPGRHHFFISFLTNYPGVKLSDALRKKYPEEITIVLQHQFEGLEVKEDGFFVTLSFESIREKIYVPFDSLVAFADPSVKFGLQFRHGDEFIKSSKTKEISEIKENVSKNAIKLNTTKIKKTKSDNSDIDKKKRKKSSSKVDENNVVSIDNFRKK